MVSGYEPLLAVGVGLDRKENDEEFVSAWELPLMEREIVAENFCGSAQQAAFDHQISANITQGIGDRARRCIVTSKHVTLVYSDRAVFIFRNVGKVSRE